MAPDGAAGLWTHSVSTCLDLLVCFDLVSFAFEQKKNLVFSFLLLEVKLVAL